MQRFVLILAGFLLLLVGVSDQARGQTGKIAGTVTDAETGEPLPGVNVVVEGEQLGATTDAQGNYTILRVPPGTYNVRASFVGYAEAVYEGVDVSIDLTSRVNFELREETQELQEVTVQAEEPVVKPDVSANVANIDAESIESMPVNSVQEVVGLQAGIEGGLQVRGSGADELDFRVNGVSMRNPRTNDPFTSIPFTSVQEVQVQTGGFNAEYGNVRSGLVNVVTREGPRDRYTADVIARYSPPARGHLGPTPKDPEAYLMRPYVSPPEKYPNVDMLAEEDVAFVGTHSDESPWDEYKRRQYPQFEGWQSVSERWEDSDKLPDLTPEQLQEVFFWYHRKEFPKVSDHLVDASFGGPIPVVGAALGDLRFMASYRQNKDAFIVPQYRDANWDRTGQMTLTTNIARGVKVSGLALYSKHEGQDDSYPSAGAGSEDGLYANQAGELENIYRTKFGLTYTHTLSPQTFIELSGQRNRTWYEFGPGRRRNPEVVKTIGGYELTEAPFGFFNKRQIYGPSGMEIGGRWAHDRDSTEVVQYATGGDLTSQITPYSQLKTGFDFYYTDFLSDHGQYSPAQPSVNYRIQWHRQAAQAAFYVQNKLEFQGMIANVGIRADYYKPQGRWPDYGAFSDHIANNSLEEVESRSGIESSFAVSPRLGISFPITTASKIYFNYGHFRNIQQLDFLFNKRVDQFTTITEIGNPSFPMSKTVSYEVGYDHSLFDTYLLRVSGYYKAQSNQPRNVQYTGLVGRVQYETPQPLNYGDIRGLEFTLEKIGGQWIRGFANYTYMIEKEANFGYAEIFADASEQLEFIRQSRLHYQSRPVPRPYSALNLIFHSPINFGPTLGGFNPLGDLRLSFIGFWRDGETIDYTGFANRQVDVDNNLEWVDDWNLDMRLTKNINTDYGEAQFFVEVNNMLGIKKCCGAGFDGQFDRRHYMTSLHLPEETFENLEEGPYLFPYGDDAPGDYRDLDVDFVPIETFETLPDEGKTRMEGEYGPLYYQKSDKTYYIWQGSSFEKAPQDKVDQVLEDKAYIDMPNHTSYIFLNPRDVWFGVRLSF